MIPAPVSRQCMKSYFSKFIDRECNCNNRKISSQSCSLWDELTLQEQSDAGVLWRCSYSTDYHEIYASESDKKRLEEIKKNGI